jgi:hypothetical protein
VSPFLKGCHVKDEALKEEEMQVGEVFIREYNRANGTPYELQPESADTEDTDADLIFHSGNELPLRVQIARIVESEDEEKIISEDLRESGSACIVRDSLDEKHVIQAVQKKMKKNYARPETLILVLYAYGAVALPRKYKIPTDIKVSFKEVWVVDWREAHRCAVRIH